MTSSTTCEVAARCGGCPELSRALTEQRARKQQRLQYALSTRGVQAPAADWLAATTEGYRNRIRVELVDGTPTFFNRQKSRQCLVLQAEVKVLLERLSGFADSNRQWLRQFRVAELRAPDSDGESGLYLRRDTAPRHLKHRSADVNGALSAATASGPAENLSCVKLGWEDGPVPLQRFTTFAERYVLVPVNAFMQIHTLANRLMVEQVVRWADDLGCETFIDLYAGCGNFSVPLAATGRPGFSVDSDEHAVLALRRALGEQGLGHCRTERGDAAQYARVLAEQGHSADLLLADPPRAGLRGQVVPLRSLARRAVVLISCRLERFVDDAADFVRQGFGLRALRLVDMFPHTDHVEVMGLFTIAQ